MSATVANLAVYRGHRRVQRAIVAELSDRSALRVLDGLNGPLAASLVSDVLAGSLTLQEAARTARAWLARR